MKGKKIVLWVLIVLLGLAFVWSGIMKLTDLGGVSSAGFIQAGLPLWFMYFIGVCEIAGGIGLFFKRTSVWAAYGLIIIMVGAIVVCLMNQPWYYALMPLVFGLLLAKIVWLRKKTRQK